MQCQGTIYSTIYIRWIESSPKSIWAIVKLLNTNSTSVISAENEISFNRRALVHKAKSKHQTVVGGSTSFVRSMTNATYYFVARLLWHLHGKGLDLGVTLSFLCVPNKARLPLLGVVYYGCKHGIYRSTWVRGDEKVLYVRTVHRSRTYSTYRQAMIKEASVGHTRSATINSQ